jgi:diacylglycerol kinase (ATP)
MKVLFVVNPQAGRGSGLKVWHQVEKLVAKYPGFEAIIPASCIETRAIAAQAVKAGIDRVIAVGGDGTINAVAGELALSDTALGVIPAGRANDFCRNSGMPRNPQDALAIAIGPQTKRIDLGQAYGGQYFLNVASLGFDAEVAAAATRFQLGGPLPYLLGAASTLYWYRPVHVDLTVDDQRFSGPSMLVAIANGRFYGGGMQIAPLARHDDGQLDVCIAGSLGRFELLNLLRQVYAGTHVGHPKVQMVRGRHVRLQVQAGVRAHLDGEPLCWDSLEFQVRPGALSVAMPPLSRQLTYPDWPHLACSRFGTADTILWRDPEWYPLSIAVVGTLPT